MSVVISATGATRADIAWAAGLFEGEGNIYSYPNRNLMTLTVGMTDLDAIEKFRNIVGVGNVNGPYQPKRPNSKAAYYWRATKFEHCQAVVAMLWDFLLARRKQRALDALTVARTIPDRRFRADGKCSRGHVVDEANSYKTARGHLICRECYKAHARDAYRKALHA